MQLYSTKNKRKLVDLRQAVLQGLPEDNGLYMMRDLPVLPPSFFKQLKSLSFQEISLEIGKAILKGSIPKKELRSIVETAFNFPVQLVKIEPATNILELFYGPSLAFKDFGARFMARTMSYFIQNEERELIVLVATSGDTGGAVAAGFHQTPGIQVVILYPSGMVSALQEKQLTTLGGNVKALEVKGTFDDCQALVKRVFLDTELSRTLRLSSANSINIARLIPQSFYYFEAWKQLERPENVVFSVPSGNFGNLTAGLLAMRMGLPVVKFLAATNINDVVPEYLRTGIYRPRPAQRTLSNAMDVGDPSNFERMNDLFSFAWNGFRKAIEGYTFTDEATKAGMRECYQRTGYVLDPHGAVGYLAWKASAAEHPKIQGIILETAHPAKFVQAVSDILETKVEIPERLASLANLEKKSISLEADFETFKMWLLKNYH